MTIHTGHPFAEGEEDPLRRFRGRTGGAVSLWTAGAGTERAGLTVTSFLVVNGDPAVVVGAVDPESALADAVAETGRIVVQLLQWRHRDLAEQLAGLMPAPGGVFRGERWHDSTWGPVLSDASAWLGATVSSSPRAVGWSQLVEAEVEHVELGPETSSPDQPLLHRRGRYLTLDRD